MLIHIFFLVMNIYSATTQPTRLRIAGLTTSLMSRNRGLQEDAEDRTTTTAEEEQQQEETRLS